MIMATIDAVIPTLSPPCSALPVTDDYSGMKFLRLSTTTRRRTAWTPGLVLRRILERERAGLPLDAGTVYREDANLVTAARRRFDSWESALKAAGVVLARRRVSHRGAANTRESIIARLQEHAAAGLPASSCHQRLKKYGSAVHRLFGTWAAAREAAGIQPIGMTWRPVYRRIPVHTRESIIALLRKHAAAGIPISSSQPLLRNYVYAARRLFGSWTAALEAAGVQPTELSIKRSLYTRDYIISRLRDHAATGIPTTSDHPSLRNLGSAIQRLFGTWAAAREAAGVKPLAGTSKRVRYTRESIIFRLREHAAAGLPVSADHPLLRNCWKAARRLFGSWPAAREAAGINPITIVRQGAVYTRESIISRLREHVAAGLPLTSTHPPLRGCAKAARRLFGSWSAARKAAGVKSIGRANRVRHTRESILALLRERSGRGESVTCGASEIRKRFSAIRRLFGTLAAARDAAGLPPGRTHHSYTTRSERGNL